MSDTNQLDALLDEIKRLQKEIEREREDRRGREVRISTLMGQVSTLEGTIYRLEESLKRDGPRLRFWIQNKKNHNEQVMATEESPSYYIIARANKPYFEVKTKVEWECVPDDNELGAE